MRPNILHIFTDQQRFDCVGQFGHPVIQTPHLDRLAREGTQFSSAYSPSPECVPARASMITGWYPGRTGCFCNEQNMPPESTPTLMSRLSDAGYETMGIGKCHFTPDHAAKRGFHQRWSQEEIVGDRKQDDYAAWLVEKGYGWVMEPHGVRGEMYYIPQVNLLPEEMHPSRAVADRTVDFLSERHGSGDPWYCFSSFIHPHPPFSPPVPWHKIYRAADMPLPDIPHDRDALITFINRFQNRYKYRDRGLDLNLVRTMRAYYFACITFIDHQIGRILSTLEETGELENTLILFTADHGEYLGDYGCFGKRGMHDVTARIPMLVRWPGADHAGIKCETPASLVDLAPTFLAAAGQNVTATDFDGLPLQRLLGGEQADRMVFSQYNCGPNGLYMAVTKERKYIHSAPDQSEILFDRTCDHREHRNLVGDPACSEVLKDFRKACLQHFQAEGQDVGDGKSWHRHPLRTMPEDPDEGLIRQDPPWWLAEQKGRELL